MVDERMQAIRKEYGVGDLLEEEMAADPLVQFEAWLNTAVAANLPEPNGMTLATATPDGQPSARTVLLKAYTAEGFVFFTNYDSRKGAELQANSRAALLFWWPILERQIRIEGQVEKITAVESDTYFYSRPRDSQWGAWVSPQSQVIAGREELAERLTAVQAERADEDPIPRPPNWGGYRVVPHRLEFWQGRPNRLHDRLCYQKTAGGDWQLSRLAP